MTVRGEESEVRGLEIGVSTGGVRTSVTLLLFEVTSFAWSAQFSEAPPVVWLWACGSNPAGMRSTEIAILWARRGFRLILMGQWSQTLCYRCFISRGRRQFAASWQFVICHFLFPDMRPVIFDTDIGTDVDDILALVLLAKAPELQLIGVTTVYGDTLLRARIAQVTRDLLQRKEVAVIPGESRTLTGRQIFWAGLEGYGVPGLDQVQIPESIGAVHYLVESAQRYGNDLEILATGPLTNIASAIAKSPEALSRIKHLYLMGGAFWMDRYEHNIRCDPEAAKIVFASGIPITAIGLDLTLRVRLGKKDVQRIGQIGGGLGPLLQDQILRWWALWQITENHPHDPLAALAMVRPDLFIFETWDVEIVAEGRREGLTHLVENKNSNIRIGFDVLARTAEREIVRRIVE